LFIISYIFLSCSNEKGKQYEVSDIPAIDFHKLERKKPSDVYQFSDIGFIQLGYNQKVLLSDNIELQLVDNFFFIFDFIKKTLYRFNKDGQFINQIGLSGKGPTEYSQVLGFAVNSKKQIVEVLCDLGCKIKQYSYDGIYLGSLNIPIRTDGFSLTAEGNYWFYSIIGNGETNYRLHFYDTINPVKSFLPLETKCFGVQEQNFSKHNNEIWFRESFFPTIYKLDSGIVIPEFKIEFGKGEINESDFIKAKDPFAFVETINQEGFYTTACLILNTNIIDILVVYHSNDKTELNELLVFRNNQKQFLIPYNDPLYLDLLNNSRPVFIDDQDNINYLTNAMSFIDFIKRSRLTIDISKVDIQGNQILYTLPLKPIK